jgi:hypothetical protein
VKSSRTGSLCIGMMLCAMVWGTAAWGQTKPQQPPPEDRQAAPGSASRPKIAEPPPPPPKLPDVRQPGETGWWAGLNAWFPTQHPYFDKGHGATFSEASNVNLPGKPKYAEGAELGVAVGLHNTLKFEYFETRANGNINSIPTTLHLWTQTYDPGTYLSSTYRLQHGKMTFEYLTWPYPIESRRFRLKTLWGVQYTSIRTVFDAPKAPIFDNQGNILVDSAGNPISYAGIGSRWFISPEFGLQTQYYKGRHFRWEASASGWTWPHRNTVWDADTSANVRYGHIELRVGAKAYHFKTNTQAEYFSRGTIGSAFVGVRWYSQ